ncbi:ribosome small subunit-dependent GTPase A [Inmirania thermothiophila]|uniref:Small ribosomal subunit biogenesis GTPase RsgA n=1 Tax=Inmirania thermothiophila TaxID=1750597 RepID=A0A3N1XZI9_9GAMM|nr:ribosome small subunit-dependent GTPase A [Inmirania thermothiophila]ROR32013.1 ribosome biogenesis GTPase [Inmirania thermothiophila]
MRRAHPPPRRRQAGPGAGEERGGLVLANYGRFLAVEGGDGTVVRCVARARLRDVVCGDRVGWVPDGSGQGVVVSVAPRHGVLLRPDRRGRPRPVAANLDRVVVVVAPQPPFDRHLLDRYLAAAELCGIGAAVLVNKADLLDEAARADWRARLAPYADMGYAVAFASTCTASGIDALAALLAGRTSILVGQSGVGKSSLVKALLPDLPIRIGRLSEATGLGRHTTTATTLYHLPRGGDLIDSPGVRAFALWTTEPREVARGFVDIARLAPACRFADCRHLGEPGCAVEAAAARGALDPERLASYRRIVAG